MKYAHKNHFKGLVKMKNNILKKIVLTFILIFVILSVSAQNNPFLVQVVDYNVDTQLAKIHIQNTAGYELNELDFYLDGIETGRIAENLEDGMAGVYFQTVSPGTHDITIKTKEGIEFTRELTFKDVTQTIIETEEEIPTKAPIAAEDLEYQKLLDAKKREKEIREQRQKAEQEKLQTEEPQPQTPIKVIEDKPELKKGIVEKHEPVDEKFDYYQTLIVISILIFIFIIIYIFKKRKQNVRKIEA